MYLRKLTTQDFRLIYDLQNDGGPHLFCHSPVTQNNMFPYPLPTFWIILAELTTVKSFYSYNFNLITVKLKL